MHGNALGATHVCTLNAAFTQPSANPLAYVVAAVTLVMFAGAVHRARPRFHRKH